MHPNSARPYKPRSDRRRFLAWTAFALSSTMLLCGITLLVAVSEAAPSRPAPPLRLDGDAPFFSVPPDSVEVLWHADPALGLSDATRREDFVPYRPTPVTNRTLWLRFSVARAADLPEDWVLAFGEPDIDLIDVYVVAEGRVLTERRLGRRFPNAELPIAALAHVAGVTLPAEAEATVYLRLESRYKLRFEKAALWRPDALLLNQVRDSAYLGIEFGAKSVLIFIYFLFGVWLLDRVMLLYAAYVATTVVQQMGYSGFLPLMSPWAHGDIIFSAMTLAATGGVLVFTAMWGMILNVKTHFPPMHRAFMLVTAAAVFLMVGGLAFPDELFEIVAVGRATQALHLVVGLCCAAAAVALIRRNPGDRLTQIYLIAFLPLALAWSAELAALTTTLIDPIAGRTFFLAATNMHMVILSVALAYRLSLLQQARAVAEANLAGERTVRRRLKTFIDMASHEFKTPLAVIDGAAQVMELIAQPKTPQLAPQIAAIRRSVRRMDMLIETCLSAERETAIHLRPTNPMELAWRTAERNHIPGRPDLLATIAVLPETITADAELLGIALDALIDNARRYGPPDQPVELTSASDGDGVTFTVSDRGSGVPEGEVKAIFEKYYRGRDSGSIPGTGIGLHLVSVIAELHGGSVTYRLRDGGGASFMLFIPFDGGHLPLAGR